MGLYERYLAPPLNNLEHLESMYLPGEPKRAGFNDWGAARPR